jgi:hypothetical protein
MAVYAADQDIDERFEIYSVPLDGGTPTKLNAPFVAGGDMTSVSFTASGIVLYRADQDVNDVFELYETTTTGLGGPSKLNAPLVTGGDVMDFVQAASGPGRVVYRADQDADEVFELYSVPLERDADEDGITDGLDCLAYDDTVWDLPGETTSLVLSHTGGVGGTTSLSWTAPMELGGNSVEYDTIRSTQAADFDTSGTCVESNDGTDTVSADSDTPTSGEVFFFLVRAENVCGGGTPGTSSAGGVRTARECPN